MKWLKIGPQLSGLLLHKANLFQARQIKPILHKTKLKILACLLLRIANYDGDGDGDDVYGEFPNLGPVQNEIRGKVQSETEILLTSFQSIYSTFSVQQCSSSL